MKQFKGTKGEWLISDDGMFIEAEDLSAICQFFDKFEQDFEYREANAKLMAASKELLEACLEFVRKVECGEARSVKSYNQMKKAINKALD